VSAFPPSRDHPGGSARPAALKAEERPDVTSGDTTRALFAHLMTRRRYAEAVGVHLKTVVNWEKHGVVKPRTRYVGSTPVRTFTQVQVDFGKRLKAVLAENNGRISVVEAAKLARRRSTRPA
jgi:hypothetical protein